MYKLKFKNNENIRMYTNKYVNFDTCLKNILKMYICIYVN